MAVPEEIRKVKRPVNSVVFDSKSNGPLRYAVRKRIGVTYTPGGNPKPKNGNIIGHIDPQLMKFIPVTEKVSTKPEILSYGSSAFIHSVSKDIYEDLSDIFPLNNVRTIMALASLKIIKPNIGFNRFNTHYKRSFVSLYYPGAALSPNSISTILENLGIDRSKRNQFFLKRISRVPSGHKIAVDGTLRQDSSVVNDLANYSFKSKIKGCTEVSILYAYDIDLKEPICSEVFPGNSIDTSSFKEFLKNNEISDGIIVADKGFSSKIMEKVKTNKKNLHYLIPLKRNSTIISKEKMLEFTKTILVEGKNVLAKSKKTDKGKWLYSFRDSQLAGKEESDYIGRSVKEDNFDSTEYFNHRDSFGTIVFESDMEMTLEQVYLSYKQRWLVELMFRMYKNTELNTETRVQNDYSVEGNEFVNFISTLISSRLIRRCEEFGLLEDISFGELMNDLSEAWRNAEISEVKSEDDKWVHTFKNTKEILEKLGLSRPLIDQTKRKRGRPKKVKTDE